MPTFSKKIVTNKNVYLNRKQSKLFNFRFVSTPPPTWSSICSGEKNFGEHGAKPTSFHQSKKAVDFTGAKPTSFKQSKKAVDLTGAKPTSFHQSKKHVDHNSQDLLRNK